MAEKKGVKGLAAMFEANISQVNTSTAPPPRRATNKLKANPFEKNIAAASSTAPAPVPKKPVVSSSTASSAAAAAAAAAQ